MEHDMMDKPVSRRSALLLALAAALGSTAALTATKAEARPPWGAPPGWSRGRKRGWSKKGGPKWR
jgi:Spy/CpxP family protein refolding chaperone